MIRSCQVLRPARLGDPWHSSKRGADPTSRKFTTSNAFCFFTALNARVVSRQAFAPRVREQQPLTPPPQVLMASEDKATSLLPSSQLIKQTLAYAKELERIV